jgi:hypothetical protein
LGVFLFARVIIGLVPLFCPGGKGIVIVGVDWCQTDDRWISGQSNVTC